MSHPRASSASATTVMLAAKAPSNGYDEMNQPSAASQSETLPDQSDNDERTPPATSTAAAAASERPAANHSVQAGGSPQPVHGWITTSGRSPATPRPPNSTGMPTDRQCRASASSSVPGSTSGSRTTAQPIPTHCRDPVTAPSQ